MLKRRNDKRLIMSNNYACFDIQQRSFLLTFLD